MSLAMRKNTFEEKKTGLNWVLSGHPDRSTRFYRVFSHPGLLSYLDWSYHQVDRVPGQPVGPVRV